MEARNVKGMKVDGKGRRQREQNMIRKEKRFGMNMKRRRMMTSSTLNDNSNSRQVTTSDINALGQQLFASSSPAEALQPIKAIRELVSSCEEGETTSSSFTAVESLQIVPYLLQLLTSVIPSLLSNSEAVGSISYQLCKEIIWCLTNLATGSEKTIDTILTSADSTNSLSLMISLIGSWNNSDWILPEHAAWLIGNVAAESQTYRTRLSQLGVIPALINRIAVSSTTESDSHTCDVEMVRTAAWALSNLARGSETSALPFIESGVLLPAIMHHLNSKRCDIGISIEVAWVLSFLSAREDSVVESLLSNGIVDVLLRYAGHTNLDIVTPMLRTIGNICTGSDDRWLSAFTTHPAFVPVLLGILKDDDAKISLLKEAVWIISRIAWRGADTNQMLPLKPFIQPLTSCFQEDSYELKRETAFCIMNIVKQESSNDASMLEEFASNEQVVENFLSMLSAPDMELVEASLDFIHSVLKSVTNGVSKIESKNGIELLENFYHNTNHMNNTNVERLCNWAQHLVDTYFGEGYFGEEEEKSCGSVGDSKMVFDFSN